MSQEGSFNPIVNDLSLQGYSVSEDLLSRTHVAALGRLALARSEEGRVVPARTGTARTANESLRGDSISWLDATSLDAPVIDCLATFDALRRTLNEQLFLNLHDIESHFAIYPVGAVYGRHLDQFAAGPQRRQVSLVLYLNQGWLATNGGELRLHLGEATTGQSASQADRRVDISPVGGRLVLFVSSQFWHEVLPSNRERVSVAGWFRNRAQL